MLGVWFSTGTCGKPPSGDRLNAFGGWAVKEIAVLKKK
jgi:hypothetical protein